MFLLRRGLGARGAWFCAIGLMLAGAGCEPTSITDARAQLERGPQRIVSLVVPIIDTMEAPGQFVGSDTATTPDGLLGIRINAQTIAVGVGSQLRFNSVTSTRFKYNVPGGVFVPGGTISADTTYALLTVEPRLTAIDTIVVDSGSIKLVTANRLNVPVDFAVTLNGFRNSLGVTLAQSGTIPQAPGDGTYVSDTVTFNLAGVTITPPSANAALHLGFTLPPGSNPALADSAIIQSGSGVIVVRLLEGPLDPAKTPELTVAVSDSQQIDSTQFNFGDLQDAFDSVSIANARLTLTLGNTSGAPLVLSSFVLRTDSAGTTITVPVADSGSSTVTLGRSQVGKRVTLPAGRLLNAVVHQALAGQRLTLRATGTAVVGDGQASRIRNTDDVSLGNLTVGLDFTLPASGVTFGRTAVTSGAGMKTQDADQVAQRVDSAGATAAVTNATPFSVQVRIALVPDSLPPNVSADSIFKMPNRVELTPVSLPGAGVDSQGRVIAPVRDTVRVGLTGTQARVLLGDRFTAGVKITLLASGPGGRGAFTPADKVVIHASGFVKLHSGGAP